MPASRVAAWTAPGLPVHFVMALTGTYFLKYGTDVLFLAPGALGLALALARLWDAFAHPAIGYWSDRSRHRLGRRRSWMLASALPLPLATLVVWAPPSALEGRMLLAWVAAGLFVLYTAMTMLDVPRLALAVELTSETRERARLFAANGVVMAVASLLALTGGIAALRTADAPRDAALALFALVSALAVAATLWAVGTLREPAENLGRGGASARAVYRDVLSNPHQRRLLLVALLLNLPMGAMAVLAPYMLEYVARRPELTETFMLLFFVPHLASAPLWVRLVARFGKRGPWLASLLLTLLAYALLYVALRHASLSTEPLGASLPTLAVAALLGVAMGANLVAPRALAADVIDWDEHRSGERKEGAYTAALGVVDRAGTAVSVALAGFALEASGFVPGAEQAPAVRSAIVLFTTAIPAAGVLLAALVLRGFSLDEREHARILAELEGRRLGELERRRAADAG